MRPTATGLAIGLAIGIAAAAQAAQDPAPRPRLLPKPVAIDPEVGKLSWVERPDWMKLFRLADDHAVDSGGDGEVHCVIGDNYRLKDCVIIRETPEGRYGAYLVAMAKEYRVKSVDAKGRSTRGVKVRLRFAIADRRRSNELEYGK